jgi:hypothetical protein
MRGRRVHWLVYCTGFYWQGGQWVEQVNLSKPFSTHARPKTKQGAIRIARRCPSENVTLISRYPATRKHPQGYSRYWR